MILAIQAVALALALQAPPEAAGANPGATPSARPDTHTLGPGDQIVVRVPDVEEISDKPVPIDLRGDIDLPMAGRIRAAGLSTGQLESAIAERLRRYLVDPDVSVYLADMRSQPVSVLGSLKDPGVHQLQGQKTLFEVLSLAGGLREDAGNIVKITRKTEWGPIPLPNAEKDPTGQYSVASVNVKDIMAATNPAANILIKPEDVISVPRADVVYAIGAVKKPGGYVLGVNQSLGVLQVLALAEGLDRTAATGNVKIMRTIAGTNNRAEIPVDLRKIMGGKDSDIPLQADDILFVPTSKTKAISYRSLEAVAQGGTMIFYRIP